MTNQPPKAYENIDFLNEHEARPIRVLCELMEPDTRLEQQGIKNTIVFFGSARPKPLAGAKKALDDLLYSHPNDQNWSEDTKADIQKARRILKLSEYYDKAVQLAEKVAEWGKNTKGKKYHVCSGGGPGMMEAANRGADNKKCESIAYGISLPFEQGVNQFATPKLSFEFHYFFIRKFYFLYHAKAVVVFPGGFGTMDELFETLTLIQTKKVNKVIPIYLFGKEFWEGLINFRQFVEWGVISPGDLDLFKVIDSVEEAFQVITNDLSDD
tara:strand:+ start:2170 stop:2976 length:807 start_codon:yes stop_codon:yes gene_type:complete